MAVLRPDHAPITLTVDRGARRAARGRRRRRRAGAAVHREVAGWSPEEFVDRILVDLLHAAASWSARTSGSATGPPATWRAAATAGASTTSRPRASPSTAARRSGRRRTSAPAWPPATSPAPRRPSAGRSPCAASSSAATSAAASSASRPPTCPTRPATATPADGVYAGWLRRLDTGERYPAAISVGTNPTFDGHRDRRVESYVLDRDRPRALRRRGRGRVRRAAARHGRASTRRGARRADERRRATEPASCWLPEPAVSADPSAPQRRGRGSSSTACPTSSTTSAPTSQRGCRARGSCWCCRVALLVGRPPALGVGTGQRRRRRSGSRPARRCCSAAGGGVRAVRAADARHRRLGAQACVRAASGCCSRWPPGRCRCCCSS